MINEIIHYFETIPSSHRSFIIVGGITLFWLIENGIEPSRLAVRGFGSEQMLFPMAQDEIEEGMNRRVEFYIAKF